MISDSEKHILESLSLFPFVTVTQVRELLFSTGSNSALLQDAESAIQELTLGAD